MRVNEWMNELPFVLQVFPLHSKSSASFVIVNFILLYIVYTAPAKGQPSKPFIFAAV